MSYCTELDIATALDITNTADAPWLAQLCITASEWIDAHCGIPAGGFAVDADSVRHFEVTALAGGVLRLDAPLISLTGITNADGVAIPANKCRLHPIEGAHYWSIRLLDGWTWAIVTDGLYSVTGRWGWSVAAPAPVREAATMLAGWMFKRYQAALQDNAAAPDLGQIVYGESIPRQVLALLAPFRSGMRLL